MADMSRRRIRTPEELKRERTKAKFTLYLTIEHIEYLEARARNAKTSVSAIADEAIAAYIAKIKDKKSE